MLPVTRSLFGRIVRVRFGLAFCCLGLVVLAILAAGTASAQTTINQTSCVSGCTNPRQDLAVDCSSGNINNALAQIADRDGPNRITVSGTCNLSVSIVGFNQLTVQGSGGATITRAINVTNSRNITLKSLNFTSTAQPGPAFLSLNSSNVLLDGVTIQNAPFANGINVGTQSVLGFTGAPSLITGNAFNGINVGAGSRVNVSNVTISNNGLQGTGTDQQPGILATDGASVYLFNRVFINPNFVDAPVDISGNKGEGILVKGGMLSAEILTNPNALVHIHDNGGPGLAMNGGNAGVYGNVKFDGNDPGGIPGIHNDPFQILVGLGGTLLTGNGAQLLGGVLVAFNSNAIIGDEGPMTIPNATLLHGSVAYVVDTNVIGALTCDATSWAPTDGQSTIQTNTCRSTGPTGNTDVTDARYLQLSGGTLTGNLSAPRFAGNGAGLTSLTPENLSAGTAGINVTGNAATATNAAALGGVSPANYARRDVGNAFIGDQSVTGSISANGSLSIGGGTAIMQHLSATYSITVPSLKPNTCTNLAVTLNGALAGANDTIALGVPNALMSAGGFLMFQAWESAANTITIRICNVNPNGPASSAVSNTIRVDLWKH